MNAGRTVRLHGWQRLWVALAFCGLLPAVGIIAGEWESGDAWLRDLGAVAPVRVQVAGVGEVEFPATMSKEAIEFVARASKGNRDALDAGVRAWGAEFGKVLDTHAMALNRRLVVRVLGVWGGGMVLLYVAGWMVGWVRRGFRT